MVNPVVSKLNPLAVAMGQEMQFFGRCALLPALLECLADRCQRRAGSTKRDCCLCSFMPEGERPQARSDDNGY